MKKHPIIFSFLLLSLFVKAQSRPLPASAYTVVTDTLHYYLNKYYFTHGTTNFGTYPIYRAAGTGVQNNNPHFIGVRFENSDTVVVNGLEGIMGLAPAIVNLIVPVRLYLCSLNVSGMPIIPAIDSVLISLNTSAGAIMPTGGNFVNSHTLTTDFAVLFRNYSGSAGDTVYVAHNAAMTKTNSVAPPPLRYSDGSYGYIRYQGQFYNTTNYTLTPGFGIGTDHEFMLAPRVSYRLQASHKIPQAILDANTQLDTLCTRTHFTFTNTSSYFFTNRFYNIMELQRKWSLYAPFVAAPASGGWPADSAITWYFEYDDQPPFIVDPRKFLAYKHQGQNQTIVAVTDRPGCYPNNEFRALLKRMAAFGRGMTYFYKEPFNICLKYCNDDVVNLKKISKTDQLAVFPNPSVDQKIIVSGLTGNSHVKLIDLNGKTLDEFYTSSNIQELDISRFKRGSYLLFVENDTGQRSWLKIIH